MIRIIPYYTQAVPITITQTAKNFRFPLTSFFTDTDPVPLELTYYLSPSKISFFPKPLLPTSPLSSSVELAVLYARAHVQLVKPAITDKQYIKKKIVCKNLHRKWYNDIAFQRSSYNYYKCTRIYLDFDYVIRRA